MSKQRHERHDRHHHHRGTRNSADRRDRFEASSGYTYNVSDLDRETAARVWSDALDAADTSTTRAAGRIMRDNRARRNRRRGR